MLAFPPKYTLALAVFFSLLPSHFSITKERLYNTDHADKLVIVLIIISFHQ